MDSVGTPSLSEFAIKGLKWKQEQIPSDPVILRAAVIADTIRMGIYFLYSANHSFTPVHNLEVRTWISHKLLPVIPDLLDSEENSYRQVLTEGRTKSLEFLGDALLLSDGYLDPGPTRFIDIGNDCYLIISGLPTVYFSSISNKIIHTQLGRRIDHVSLNELQELNPKVQSIEDYLENSTKILPPDDLINTILSSSFEPWISDPGWEIYLGNLEPGGTNPNSRYGFCFVPVNTPSANKALVYGKGVINLSIYKRRLLGSERYYSYWLKEQTGTAIKLYSLRPGIWKQACIALDYISGKSRHAFISEIESRPYSLIYLGFPPFEALSKALNAFGSTYKWRTRGLDVWEIHNSGIQIIRNMLERIGLKIEHL